VLTTTLFDLKVYGLDNIPLRGGALIVSNSMANIASAAGSGSDHRPITFLARH
jgi:hypothetical protein